MASCLQFYKTSPFPHPPFPPPHYNPSNSLSKNSQQSPKLSHLSFSPNSLQPPMASETSNNEILHDLSPLLREYKDGRVERFMGLDMVDPSPNDPDTGVQSKDIIIAPEINVGSRIFLPKNPTRGQKLPVLVYFHGGAFVIGSAFSPMYQKHLNLLVSEANVLAVSVNYRLAPEHPLPTAYEDSWLALKWVVSQSDGREGNKEEWINEFGDLTRLYLGGDSAGANIAHHMGLKIGIEKLDGVNLCGVFLNCPYFWGKDKLEHEIVVTKKYENVSNLSIDNLWKYACPGTEGSDDPWMNPGTDPNLSGLVCKRVLVFVAEKDVLKERGWYYKEVLEKSGWEGDVEVVEAQGEDHVYSLLVPDCENSLAMFKRLASFLNNH